jgi:hypothetical protein
MAKGVFVFSFSLFFISFWEIKKLDGHKSEKLRKSYIDAFSFSFFELSNF